MRAAGKAARLGSLRGFVPEAALSGSSSQAAIRSSPAEESKLGVSAPSNANSDQPVQAVSVWELEDWELEGEEFVTDKYSTTLPSPRIVFGPVPSIDEAKEATHDLKETLDKIYFSPLKSSENEGMLPDSQEVLENKSCVSTDALAVATVPNQAYNAFKMLRESTAAQDAVASIVSDPNVWNAVLNNKAFLDYCGTEKSYSENEQSMETDSCEGSSTDESKPGKQPKKNFFENVKMTITGMVDNFLGYVQEFFGGSDKNTGVGSTEGSPGVMAVGGSLLGLAVMVILVVSMKRA